MSVAEQKNYLRQLAERIYAGDLTPQDATFLSDALNAIADGGDPKEAMKIKGRRGHKTGDDSLKKSRASDHARRLAQSWVETAIAPEDKGGLGLTVEQALEKAEEHFKFTFETLKKYRSRHPENNSREFTLPE